MAVAVPRALATANIALNAALHRRPWASCAAVYAFAMLLFSIYRLANLSAIAALESPGDEDSAGLRVSGVLFGLVQDAVVASYLVAALFALDAAFNRLSCCNDTAPNGCLDCFTHGLYFAARLKLLLKRCARAALAFAVFGAMVAAVATDAVLVRSRRCRFSFDWLDAYLRDSADAFPLAIERAEEEQLAYTAVCLTLGLAAVFAAVSSVWVDLTRWHPLERVDWQSLCRSCQRERRVPTVESLHQPSINYIVIEHGEFFDSDDNQLRGTLSLMGQAMRPGYDSIELASHKEETESAWHHVAGNAAVCVLALVVVPILLTVVALHLPPVTAQIALNVNLSEPVRAISGYGLYPSDGAR